MKKTALLSAMLVVALVACPGCFSRAVKEVGGAALGASGKHLAIQPAGSLAAYSSYELGTTTSQVGRNLPGNFFRLLPSQLQKELADKDLARRHGGKALLINVDVIHYESAGLMGQAFGPFEEVIARVTLADKATGSVLGTANCVGRSQSTSAQGVEEKAAGLAKAIAGWIESQTK